MTNKPQEIIRIAVTGHRFINSSNELNESIQDVFAKIFRDHAGSNFHLLSALAEGSDQLVARIAQNYQEIKLFVPLPLPEERYLLDFHSVQGRNTFQHLIGSAIKVMTLTDSCDHDLAYDHLGEYLVHECSILIAIWNGEYSDNKGSTGEVVKKAIKAGKPVYWIYCENGNDGSVNNLSKRKKVGEIQVLPLDR